MLYMFLIHNEPDDPAPVDEAVRRHLAVAEQARAKGAYIAGESLGRPVTATTVRKRDGVHLATDGPFIETREFLAGFHIIDCADLDEAIAYAKQLPEGPVEIRPLRGIPGWQYEVAPDRERAPMTE